ncbi:DUF982 domain-containing protein [Mesorhizobium sp.]|uniref:DUF982 domain-containing protein n=1 Tax=Mesorhizobium sp. TaxID=1871066 RepID=UPI00338F47D3
MQRRFCGTAPLGRRPIFHDDDRFRTPSRHLFRQNGSVRTVKSVREAAEYLMSNRWPSHSGEAFEAETSGRTWRPVSSARKRVCKLHDIHISKYAQSSAG